MQFTFRFLLRGTVACLILSALATRSDAALLYGLPAPVDFFINANAFLPTEGNVSVADSNGPHISLTRGGGTTQATVNTVRVSDSFLVLSQTSAYGAGQAVGQNARANVQLYLYFKVDSPETYTFEWSKTVYGTGGINTSNNNFTLNGPSGVMAGGNGVGSGEVTFLASPGQHYWLAMNQQANVAGGQFFGVVDLFASYSLRVATTTVPEPASVLLALVVGVGLANCRCLRIG